MGDTDEVTYDPLDPEFLANPYPVYARLRDDDPLHRSPFGFWVLSRHRHCFDLLRDPSCSVDYRSLRHSLEDVPNPDEVHSLKDLYTFLFLDPPEHTRIRIQLADAFTPAAIEPLHAFISSRVQVVVDQLQDGEPIDLIDTLAYPLPIDVICRILGLADTDWHLVRAWSKALARGLDPEFTQTADSLATGRRALHELLDFFYDEIAQHTGGDTLLGRLATSDDLSVDEIARNCALLLVAGHETTANLLGNGLLALLQTENSSAAQRLADHREDDLIDRTVEELLRYDSPIQVTKRVPLQPINIDGVMLEAGDMVVLLLGAANRDPTVFPQPDQLDLDRVTNPHIAFGGGPHYCIGARLARLEARITLNALAALLPNLVLDEPEPPVKQGVIVRGRERLVAKLT